MRHAEGVRGTTRFLIDLKARLAQFALTLHPEKTRLIEFGKFAADRRSRRGLGKPETFDFLGFTHICATKADGSGFQLWRKTIRKRLKAKLKAIKEELRRHVNASIDEQGRWLGSVSRWKRASRTTEATLPIMLIPAVG